MAQKKPTASKGEVYTPSQRMSALKTYGPKYITDGNADALMNHPSVKGDPAVLKEAMGMYKRMTGKDYVPKTGRGKK